MDIRSSNTHFGVKFLDSPDLRDIVVDSVKKGKFDKLNQARKNMDKLDLKKRLKVDLCYTNDKPTIIFSRYEPDKRVLVPLTMNDYILTAITEFTSTKKHENILKFARRMIVKMGNDVQNNNMYRQVVKDNVPGFKVPKYDVYTE